MKKVYILISLIFSLNVNATCFKTSNVFNSNSENFEKRKSISVNEHGVIIPATVDKKKCETDFSQYYIVPGLVDTHTHFLILDKTYGQNFSAELVKDYNTNESMRIARAINIGKSYIQAGITSVRDLGNSGMFLDEKISKNQISNFPRFFYSGPGFASAQAQFAGSNPHKEYFIPKNIKEVKATIALCKQHNVNLIKVYADNDPGKGELSRDLLCAVVKEAHKNKLKVAAHATNERSAQKAINCNADSIEHGLFISDESLMKMAQKKIILVPTDFTSSVHEKLNEKALLSKIPVNQLSTEKYRGFIKNRLDRAAKLGVKMAFGSDMYLDLSGLGMTQGSGAKSTIYSYVDNGLSNKQALLMATKYAGELVGQQIGKLDIGYNGDFIVLKKNPLDDIRALDDIVAVVKSGQIIK